MNLSRFADHMSVIVGQPPGSPANPLLPVYLLDNYNIDGILYLDTAAGHADTGHGRKLVCRLCQALITDESRRVDFMGRNLHCRTNPAGYSYTFACFSDAPGCAAMGRATTEHSWFAGHAWQVALCRHCGEHLGWLFKGSGRCYGLIQGRVISGSG